MFLSLQPPSGSYFAAAAAPKAHAEQPAVGLAANYRLRLASPWLSYPSIPSWSSPQVLATMIIGVVGLIGFGLYEWLGRSDGIVAHVLFRRNRNFILAVVAFSTEGFIFFSAVSQWTPQSESPNR